MQSHFSAETHKHISHRHSINTGMKTRKAEVQIQTKTKSQKKNVDTYTYKDRGTRLLEIGSGVFGNKCRKMGIVTEYR